MENEQVISAGKTKNILPQDIRLFLGCSSPLSKNNQAEKYRRPENVSLIEYEDDGTRKVVFIPLAPENIAALVFFEEEADCFFKVFDHEDWDPIKAACSLNG